jgi:hypothetical protein
MRQAQWQLQTAKAQLSEVVDAVSRSGLRGAVKMQ